MNERDFFISIRQASERYGVSRRMLWRMVQSGQIKKYKLGGCKKALLRESELDSLIEVQERPRAA